MLSNYQEPVVLDRLGLTTTQLRNKLKSQSKDGNSTKYKPITAKPCEFIECDLKTNKIQSKSDEACFDIEIKNLNGTMVLIKQANQAVLSTLSDPTKQNGPLLVTTVNFVTEQIIM